MIVSLASDPELVKKVWLKPGASSASVGDFVAAVADGHVPKPRKPVQVTPALHVGQPHAVGSRDDACAFGIQRVHIGERVDMMACVAVAQVEGGFGVVHDLIRSGSCAFYHDVRR